MDKKDFDFEHLTKEQTLYLHRKLWNTLADKILEWKRPVEKWEIFDLYGWPGVLADCWCCAYSETCQFCPIQWTDDSRICSSIFSPYQKWRVRMDEYKYFSDAKDYKIEDARLKELYDLAKAIATLPERKE